MNTFSRQPNQIWQAGMIALGAMVAQPALAVDWSAVPGKQVTLFYPGQASFEWVLTQSDHSGAPKIREGKHCSGCHRGEEAKIGALIVSGKKLEPNPIPGKAGSVKATVKIAHDANKLYVHLEWTEPPAPSAPAPAVDKDYELKTTMMIDDGSVVAARLTGCWATCHADLIGMPYASPNAKLTKYLAQSRTKVTREGGDERYKSAAELKKLMDQGIYMELWQARANKGARAVAADGYVLEKRHMNSAPIVNATASFSGEKWTVELSRALAPDKPGHKDIVPGKTYHIGFAIHGHHAAHRYHDVSLGYTLVLDRGNADFVARKQ